MPSVSLLPPALIFSITFLTLSSSPTYTQSAQGPRTIEVTAKRFEYIPSEITVKKGEPVVLSLHSLDVAHGLKFSDLHLQTEISKNGSSELHFTPDRVGTFVGHCSHFCGAGHGLMILKLHVIQ